MSLRTASFTLMAAFAISGCVDPNTVPVSSKPISSRSAISQAKYLVSESMRDPEATRFKDEFGAYELSNGDIVVCGTVNGKNAMGGYVGYRPFYIRMRNNASASFHVPSEDDTYSVVANSVRQACADAASGSMMISE